MYTSTTIYHTEAALVSVYKTASVSGYKDRRVQRSVGREAMITGSTCHRNATPPLHPLSKFLYFYNIFISFCTIFYQHFFSIVLVFLQNLSIIPTNQTTFQNLQESFPLFFWHVFPTQIRQLEYQNFKTYFLPIIIMSH